ncbi:hypothetical protein JY651_14680 [Pyxidicoccus parkwayensis]|uniref:Lipoprotein n=1 Tax=Pyxidicoccus parkwayensis TaxID=2813578 RepID=A0ABX7P6I1_9BACT|nr:hypothetical protein [Pyxidicoccus parkwaysis]QSQ26090.1 hypothetical protein JY651_14680 [Pyxidicoccus parkwaysis]
MRFALAIVVLAGGLGGCGTLNTSGMSELCRNEYNSCLDTCQSPTRASNRFPEGPASNKPQNTETDFDTPSCVSACNERAKSCS